MAGPTVDDRLAVAEDMPRVEPRSNGVSGGVAPSSVDLALRVRGLTVRYGGFVAVDSVDLDVPNGSLVGLIGPNGAGKSSCFGAIGGTVRPRAGTIAVHGKELTRITPRKAWAAGIGRTFQRPELYWTLTVRDHVELARHRARRKGRSPRPVDELLSLLGLETLADAIVGTLSLGTNRLVELARAIATDSRLVLMDEPCSGLDHGETETFKDVLAQIRAELGLSLLIVEHDMDFILTVADRLYVLNYGRLIADGTPDEIRASPVVREAYLGGEH